MIMKSLVIIKIKVKIMKIKFMETNSQRKSVKLKKETRPSQSMLNAKVNADNFDDGYLLNTDKMSIELIH